MTLWTLRRFLPHLVVAAAIAILGWQVYAAGARSVQEKWDASEAARVLADQAAAAKAQADKDAALIPIVAQRDKAIALLQKLRARQSQPLTVEVPSENACPQPRIGDLFLELWNSAAEAHNAMHETRGGDAAASPTSVRPAGGFRGEGSRDASRAGAELPPERYGTADRD